MTSDKINQFLEQASASISTALTQPETYSQLGIVITVYVVAFFLAQRIRHHLPFLDPLDQR